MVDSVRRLHQVHLDYALQLEKWGPLWIGKQVESQEIMICGL